ncbi:hypothetical protein BDZ94DRAFT_1310398 [Collybia nuda]|uniref:Uncharacterized protein n=1 Tax=Collybia nuda TaxID=64659 RepID=A0A9P6CDC4_9AGAR|nr:hypothetical protein BDZ94DRAFT_1310398 [Collybia nuda]
MAIYLLWSLFFSTNNPEFALLLVATTSKYFFSVTLGLTLACTSAFLSDLLNPFLFCPSMEVLIAYKLWSVARHVRPILSNTHLGGYRRLSKVATIIFESAAIYSSLLIAMIITDVHGITSFFILFKMGPPLIGIVFSSIIVSTRVNTTNTSGSTTTSFLRFLSRHRKINEAVHTTTSGSGREGVHVETVSEDFKESEHSVHDRV